MAKNYSNKNRTRKSLIAMLCALSVTCTGLAAACANNGEDDEQSNAVAARDDTQLLKNGNFEHFAIPDKAVHFIRNVNNWSLGGDTSVKSGVINVSDKAFKDITDEELSGKLDYNNDLSSDNEEYVDYNGMRSRDLLYKDNYAAMLEADDVKDSWIKNQGYEAYFGIVQEGDNYYIGEGEGKTQVYKNEDDGEFYFDTDFTKYVRKQTISNPKTHYDINDDNTKITVDGKEYDLLTEDITGSLYYKDGDGKENYVSNVLMIHNSPTDTKFNGVNQYYTASAITLEANTSAEISFWVKTSDLKFDKGYSALEDEDKGAYVEIIQQVNSTTIDNFSVKAINTEKIIAGAPDNALDGVESNGWLNYTVYVNACDFASSTVQIRLGLGGSDNNEKVTGYAFFDDVKVTKYRSLEDEKCSYGDYASEITAKGTSCNLTSEADDKIFYADILTRGSSDTRHAYDFRYLIDLASEQGAGNVYNSFEFGAANVTAALTTEKDSKGKIYAATTNSFNTTNVGKKTQSDLNLVKDTQPLPTSEDIIGAFAKNHTFTGTYAKELNDAVKGLDKLPAKDGGNILALFSEWGVPYTATITPSFSVGDTDKDGYYVVSLWVKTSDMDGGTAATLKIYEEDENGLPIKDSAQTLTIDTTGNKTNFENQKDIYEGWVQCFFFVKNDTDVAKNFKIDFSFGTTAIINAAGNYNAGWAVVANMQTLEIDKEIYDLASSGTTTALFSFSNEDESESGKVMDEATGTSDIKTGIATPDKYVGKNGGSSSVTDADSKPSFDAGNTNALAGLINKEHAESYANWSTIATSFGKASGNWNDVFGENCYQPLIIINDVLRKYADKADATEETFDNGNYYLEAGENETGADIITALNGKKYKPAAGTTWDENATYYTLSEVANYGFIGEKKSVSANNAETVSVRVKVTGTDAFAYVYLVNPDDKNILSYNTPDYTFYYDEEGNVLDEEFDSDWNSETHRKHIVYTLRDDGLYDGKDGKVYANLHNLIKTYKDSKFEHNNFFDKDGNPVNYDDLKDGEDYYLSATDRSKVADHYLCNSNGENVYEYKDGKYFYLVKDAEDGKMKPLTEVNAFDKDLARYNYTALDKKFAVKITAEDCAKFGDENGWITVNFVIQAGSDAKDYRLELWNGARDEKGSAANTSAVAFDISQHTVNNVETRLKQYETEILNAYYNLIKGLPDGTKLFDEIKTENISAYEELLKKHDIEDTVKADYGFDANYYTYTLYDSAAYVPFNADTASDGETGYNYDPSLFTEKLAFLKFDDEQQHSRNVFVDYSAVDQSITKNTATDDGDDSDTDDEAASSAELGLYISSIVLVVVLLITLVSIGITQYIKSRRKKNSAASNKNVYRKRDRYIRKLHLVKNEETEVETSDDNGGAENNANTSEEVTPDDTTTTEETNDGADEENPSSTVEETSGGGEENKE